MKKLIVLAVLGALSASAIADLAYIQFQGGKLYDENNNALPSGVYTDAAVIFLGDRTPHLGGDFFDHTEFQDPYTFLDISIGPDFAGGTYQTEIFTEDPSSIIGETITLVIDPNGGGIGVGDIIGTGGTTVIQDMTGIPSGPQTINTGDIFINIQEVPEPSTIGLIGIAGISLLLARKKKLR